MKKKIWVKMNDYEKMRLKRIQENKAKLLAAGIFEAKNYLNGYVKNKTLQPNSKRNVLDEDEDSMSSGGSEELSVSSEGENSNSEEEFVIAERSIAKNKQRRNMSDVIADETGHGKTSQPFDNEEELVIAERSIAKNKQRRNMSDVIADETGHGKTSQTFDNEEELVIAERSILKNKRKRNMSDVIADETGPGKTSRAFNKFQPNTRSRVARETRSLANLTNKVIYEDASKIASTGMHQGNLDTPLLESPMGSMPQNPQQVESILHEIPLDEEEPVGTTMLTKSTRRSGRSFAKPWPAWDNGVKKILEWNDKCQPLGPLQPKLMSHLGNLARNGDLFPLTMLSWLDADDDVLDNIWDSVKANTNAPEGFKDICFNKMGTCWRHFKNRIKDKYYNKVQTDEKRLSIVPPRVEPGQWPILVRYWGLKKIKKKAVQNSKNRGAQCAYSRTGRTPHAIIIDEMVKQGKPVDQITIWNQTRNPKNKSFNTEDGALQRADHLERQLNELSEEERNDPETRNKIFMDVVGCDGHGHALLKGVGTKVASKRSNASSSILLDELAQLRKDAEDREILHKQVIEEREALHKQEVEEREARYQQELQLMKAEMRHEFISLMKNAGIQVLDNTPCTPTNHN